jgi:hypothetical protein
MKGLIFLISTLCLFTGCQESVFQSLKKTDDLYVYEGLPHPGRENPSFEKERKREDVRQIQGHWFYEPKVKASGEIRDRLMNLLFDESGFSVPGPNTPQKDCGPFHPDYAIAWKSEGKENYLMICYTCGEAKLISEGKSVTYEVYSNLQVVLSEFQSKRLPKQ